MQSSDIAPAYAADVAEPLLPEPAVAPVPMHWTPLGRVGFRIAFLYFFCFLFLFGNGTLFQIFPVAGQWIQGALTWPTNHLAQWVGAHAFHLKGLAATWHPTGSGDTALNWILNGLFVVFALAGGLIWTTVATLRGNRRTEYQTLYAWLRFLLRLTVGMFMLLYGVTKIFPLQMAPISIAILNEPVGQTSPMTLLWSLIGLNPVYESVCGFAEALGGALILFRRTALFGALLSAFVMTNVVLFNFFFDVPVKLFALSLLLAQLFIILPDVRPLFNFFWRHEPSAPVGVWVPPSSRREFRIATRTIEIVYTAVLLLVLPVLIGTSWHHQRVAARTPSPLLGAWHLDPTHPASGVFITGDGLPASDLYIDTLARAFTRSTDGELWRTGLDVNSKAHTVAIYPYGGKSITYACQMRDPNHLTLTSMPPKKPKLNKKIAAKSNAKPVPPFVPAVVTLTRTPVPAHYPLLDRGFHFVNQWGLER